VADNILYYITRWGVGTAYKNIRLMQKNFGGIIIKDDLSQAIECLQNHDIKIIVVRGDNRPDFRLATKRNIPYILIENDISSMRCGNDLKLEKEMLENASAVIFTSEEHSDYCNKKYNIKYSKVIHTRPLKEDLEFVKKPKLDGLNLVYAGGMSHSWRYRFTDYGYRAYHEIFKRFIDNGWNVHLYPAIDRVRMTEYQAIGCIPHGKLPYKELLSEMSQYTAGFHGYNKDDVPEMAWNYTKTCRGNKIWDYLMAGIPTIGYQGGNGMKIYNNKWGIALRSLNDKVIQNIPSRLEKINITDELKLANVMDNDLNIYEGIIDKAMEESKIMARLPKVSIPKEIRYKDGDIVIQVENKRPYIITRGGFIFNPQEKTKPLVVSKMQWKEIKAHVGLRILYIQGGII